MAVGKEAPIPDICMIAAASREALSAAVAELTETIASLPLTTVKRRLRDAEIVLPYANSAAAGANGFSPYAKIEGLEPKVVECLAPESTEGLDEKI
jgi:hypothetical protein